MEGLGEKSIELIEFETVKETTYGYWIRLKDSPYSKQKFVLKQSKKRYAYPTKDEAFNSFRVRTYKSLEYAKRDVENATDFVKLIEDFEINHLKKV